MFGLIFLFAGYFYLYDHLYMIYDRLLNNCIIEYIIWWSCTGVTINLCDKENKVVYKFYKSYTLDMFSLNLAKEN